MFDTIDINWTYEDCLPEYMTDGDYDALYPFSKIEDGVRLFPRCCRNKQFGCEYCSSDKNIVWFGCRACWYDDGNELVLERRREAGLLKKKSDEAIGELCEMLYKDLIELGDTPQEALDKVVRGVLPLMG